jgi:hypothetical protein
MRISHILVFILVLYIPGRISYAQVDLIEFPELTERAQISLITGEPGPELAAKFGHSAIRVYDPENGIDLVYNYGTYDFNAPGFYQKFLMGKLSYSLSVYEFKRMVYAYKYYNQSLYEQVLNLNYDEKVELYNIININYLPENRYYPYDFFFDNCSSRIRDVLENVLGEKLYFDDQHIKKHKTFRQLLDEFLYSAKWGDFGIDLIIGRPADVIASSREYMFLPYKLFDAFEYAQIIRDNGKSPLVQITNIINQSVNIPGKKEIQVSPLLLFWTLFLLVLALSLIFNRNKKVFKYIDTILFLAVGFAGLLISFLWFVTEHIPTKDNLNLLWAFPFHLILPYMILRNIKTQWKKYYLQFWIIFLILFLASWTILPQQMNIANIPIILMLIVRFFYNSKNNNRKDVERRK